MIKNKKTLAVSSLILSALFFGGTFIVVKNLLDNFSPINIVFLRYAIASLLFLFTGGIPTKKTIKPGILMGLFLWIGYVTQTQGLLTTSTINSGVVTGFILCQDKGDKRMQGTTMWTRCWTLGPFSAALRIDTQ